MKGVKLGNVRRSCPLAPQTSPVRVRACFAIDLSLDLNTTIILIHPKPPDLDATYIRVAIVIVTCPYLVISRCGILA